MKILPAAALLLLSLLIARPALAFEKVDGPLAPRNLAGTWGVAFVYMQREGFSTHIRRSLPDYYFEFERVKGKRVWLKKISESSNEVLRRTRIKVRRKDKTFGLILSSNSALVRKGIPFYYLDPLHSQNGVDVMQEGDTGSTILIRFRRTKEAVEAGFGQLRFKEFCGGPVRVIAKPAKTELDAAQRLVKRYPEVFRRYRVANAARIGLFLSPEFKRAFGIAFDEFSDEAQTQFLERLKYCAVVHPDRALAEPIAKAVLNTSKRRNVRGFLKLGNTTSRYPSLRLAVVGGAVHFLARQRKIAIKDFEKLVGSLRVEEADLAKLEAVLQEIGIMAKGLSPSRIQGIVNRIGQRIALLKRQEKAAASKSWNETARRCLSANSFTRPSNVTS